ncbi:hypothetical protein IFM58399_09006 [Aspergillus lentulus]|uniref:uncharacterized protein n=1 Tax=Aspergillus lentulus TaxID=293939 RepID=UPI001393159A|nr:uncharacterized protein IFM58399_09006 [Aspergillus lentulus]GFF51221.1 hypothetical protein IFM58399_09006 [Aspergillus lentulus]
MTVCPEQDHGQVSGRPVVDRLIIPNVQLLVHSILQRRRDEGLAHVLCESDGEVLGRRAGMWMITRPAKKRFGPAGYHVNGLALPWTCSAVDLEFYIWHVLSSEICRMLGKVLKRILQTPQHLSVKAVGQRVPRKDSIMHSEHGSNIPSRHSFIVTSMGHQLNQVGETHFPQTTELCQAEDPGEKEIMMRRRAQRLAHHAPRIPAQNVLRQSRHKLKGVDAFQHPFAMLRRPRCT